MSIILKLKVAIQVSPPKLIVRFVSSTAYAHAFPLTNER